MLDPAPSVSDAYYPGCSPGTSPDGTTSDQRAGTGRPPTDLRTPHAMTEDVPGYRVLEKVGEGGFSVVYRAYQERLDRPVALKVLSISAVDDAAMKRFQRECKITGRLTGHPNIVTVLDTGTTRSNRPYI